LLLTYSTRKYAGHPRHRKKKRLSDSEVGHSKASEALAAPTSAITLENPSASSSATVTEQAPSAPTTTPPPTKPQELSAPAPASTPTPRLARPSRLAGMLYGTGEKKPVETVERLAATTENAIKVWQEFLKDLQLRDHLMYNFASTASVQLKENEVIFFDLSSNLSDSALLKMKTDILQYFKKKMSVENPSMETNVVLPMEIEGERNDVGTPSERLNLARQQNPALGALIDQLGLDFN